MTTTDGGNGSPPPSGTWLGWRASVDARLDGLKSAVDGSRWVVGIVAVIMIGGFSFLGFQLSRLENRVDRIETAVGAIPARLSEEFLGDAGRDGGADQRNRQFNYRHSAGAAPIATNHCCADAPNRRDIAAAVVGRSDMERFHAIDRGRGANADDQHRYRQDLPGDPPAHDQANRSRPSTCSKRFVFGRTVRRTRISC